MSSYWTDCDVQNQRDNNANQNVPESSVSLDSKIPLYRLWRLFRNKIREEKIWKVHLIFTKHFWKSRTKTPHNTFSILTRNFTKKVLFSGRWRRMFDRWKYIPVLEKTAEFC